MNKGVLSSVIITIEYYELRAMSNVGLVVVEKRVIERGVYKHTPQEMECNHFIVVNKNSILMLMPASVRRMVFIGQLREFVFI